LSPDFVLEIVLAASVSPSEDPRKVAEAMKSVVGNSKYDLQERHSRITVRSDDPRALDKMHDQLRDRHVRGAAQRLLLRGREGDSTRLMLNRQAAIAGVIVLCGNEKESPLGPIIMTIRSKQLDAIVEWLASYERG